MSEVRKRAMLALRDLENRIYDLVKRFEEGHEGVVVDHILLEHVDSQGEEEYKEGAGATERTVGVKARLSNAGGEEKQKDKEEGRPSRKTEGLTGVLPSVREVESSESGRLSRYKT